MPIRPENKARYPANWKEIRAEILSRANQQCEQCGVRNGAIGFRKDDGAFVELARPGHLVKYVQGLNPDLRCFQIVLTIAHLDHIPEHCHPSNLRAWCQKCHLNYDAQHHAETAYKTRRTGLAIADLFGD